MLCLESEAYNPEEYIRFLISMLNAYLWNNKYVFGGKERNHNKKKKLLGVKMKKIKVLFQNSDLWVAVLSIIALASLIIPMMWITQYIWPCSDDFELSLWTKKAWDSTGEFLPTFKEALKFIVYKYLVWQGSFSSIFLMAIQPGIWGNDYYAVGAIFIILSLLFGIYYLTYNIIVKLAKANISSWLTLTTIPLFFCLLRIMYPEELFYWWTGASYYTGFFSWSLIVMGVMLKFISVWSNYKIYTKVIYYILGGFACLFIGGGNYPTTLLLLEVAIGLTVWAFINKKSFKWIFFTYSTTTLISLVISVIAPGNMNHITSNGEISVIEAIFISIRDGLTYMKNWSNISIVMMLILLIPIALQVVKAMKISYKYPIVFSVLSGGLYLSMYAPISYTFGGFAPGRMINLFYICYYILIIANLIYWVGWIYRKSEQRDARLYQLINKQIMWQSLYILIVGMCFAISVIFVGVTNTNLYKIYVEIKNDVFQDYDQFMIERVGIFEENQGEVVEIEHVPYQSEITFFSDIFPDYEHLVNRTMAEYYGVKEIHMK